jgi:CheY-like chemotaxis protein
MIARLTGLRILLAEDNELNRVVTRDTLSLELSHLTLDEAMNGEVAVAMVAAQDYDVILMDVNMPVLDGYEATKRIRTRLQGRKSQTPILALTAGVVRTDLERAIAAGMNGYVTKPFKTGDLLTSIYNALEGVTQSHLKHDEIDRTTTVDVARITDLAFLRELTQGDDSLMQKYVAMYFTSTPENLRRIHADMDRSDIQAIARTTHQLKTHLRFMGMQSTAELAEQIEQLAATGTDTKEIATLIARLSEDCERSYEELRSKA